VVRGPLSVKRPDYWGPKTESNSTRGNVVVQKALRGLATANLRSLRLSFDRTLRLDYLRDLERVYWTYT
jgi:hypothetical protein